MKQKHPLSKYLYYTMKYIISESQHRFLSEQNKQVYVHPSISQGYVRKRIEQSIIEGKYPITNKGKRRYSDLLDEYAENLMDKFHTNLDYLFEDDEFERIVRILGEE